VTSGEDLRALMRFVPHNVAVLAVDYDGDRMGVTISSLVSLSLEPPLVAISIGKQASLYELLRQAGTFAVSVLGGEQEEIALRFAAGRSGGGCGARGSQGPRARARRSSPGERGRRGRTPGRPSPRRTSRR